MGREKNKEVWWDLIYKAYLDPSPSGPATRFREEYCSLVWEDLSSGLVQKARESTEMSANVGDRVKFVKGDRELIGRTGTVIDKNDTFLYLRWDNGKPSGGYFPERFEKLPEFTVGDRVQFRGSASGVVYEVLTAPFKYGDAEWVVLSAPITKTPRTVKTELIEKHVEKWKVGEVWRGKAGGTEWTIIHVHPGFAVGLTSNNAVAKLYNQDSYVKVR